MKGRLLHITVLFLMLWGLCLQASAVVVCEGGDSIAYEREADYYYLQALSLVEQEKYDAAFDMLEHCRALQPSSSAVLYELVNMYQYLGHRDEALAILKKIVGENPGNYHFWLSLVQFYDTENNRDAVLKVYEEMAVAFPDKSDVFFSLSAHYAEQAMYPEAVAALERYEEIEGRDELVSMQKFRMYVIMQQRDKAFAELKALSAEYPDDQRFRAIEADTYYMLGEKDTALAIYNDILEKEPTNVAAQLSLVEHYKEAGNDSLYVQQIESLLKNEKFTGKERVEKLSSYITYRERIDSAGCYAYVTNLLDTLIALPYGSLDIAMVYSIYLDYSRKGEKEQLPIINKILSLEPDNRYARKMKLQYAIERNNYTEIIAECDTAIMYHPDRLEFYHYKGLACHLLGRKDDAVQSYKAGIERCSPDTDSDFIAEVYSLLADAYYDMGKMDEAFAAYDSSLSYNSTNVLILNNYAYYLALENRELERALEMSFHTLKEEPEEVIYIDTYAWILFRLGRYDEAKEYVDKLLQAEGEASAVVLHHCGDIYSKCGELQKAVECWVQAQKAGDNSKILKRKIKKKKYIPDGKKK